MKGCSPLPAGPKTEPFTNSELLQNQRRTKGNNHRRFSNEQIESLESIYSVQTKLDPRKTTQVAGELGLQPRQVAIWFQNRRARCKSKQIAEDYRVLKANYDHLNSHYESLKKEKQSLLIQLQELSQLQEHHHDDEDEYISNSQEGNAAAGTSTDTILEQGLEQGSSILSDDAKRDGEDNHSDPQDQCIQEYASLTPTESWSNFELNDSCESSNWWNFFAS